MITAKSTPQPYLTAFAGATAAAHADTKRENGGGGQAPTPIELLEAAVATCMVISVRMMADRLGIALGPIEARVEVDRSRDGEAAFRYAVDLPPSLAERDRARLVAAAERCSVKQLLMRRLVFLPAPAGA